MRTLRLFALGAAAGLAGPLLSAPPPGRALLLVSVDGLRPDYATSAAHAAIRIPNLRRLMREGVHAATVRGVLPSVTYPSHTTLVTGVHPARHGIYSNRPFDLVLKNADAWFWYSEDIRVPTLWDAAAGAGYVTGSISWPVTVGARSIRYNLPEFAGTRTPEDIKMIRALAGGGWLEGIEKKAGPYLTDVNRAIPRDWIRTRYAVEMIRQRHVRFLTVHLAALDHEQHKSGPFSPHAVETLEEIDRMLGEMRDAILAEDAGAAVCVVSDHGFAPVERYFKLDAAFVKAGLIKLRGEGDSLADAGVAEWTAMPWTGGASAAIMLRDPTDAAARVRVRDLLNGLAADAANGIAGVLDPPAIAKLGGDNAAAFWVDMRPGFTLNASLAGPLVVKVSPRGTHGHSPAHPELGAFFAVAGRGVRQGARLEEIDMRAIAPTLAGLMGARFPSAESAPVPVLAGRPGH